MAPADKPDTGLGTARRRLAVLNQRTPLSARTDSAGTSTLPMALRPTVLGELPPMAHHPPCPHHDHHLIYVAKRPLCLGCVCLGAGLLAGAGATVLVLGDQSIQLGPWLSAHAGLVAPTVFQPWLQYKAYKILARFLLGLASATWCLTAVGWGAHVAGVDRWLFAASSLVFFALMVRLLLLLRQRYTASPCDGCPQGVFPTCAWSLEQAAKIEQSAGHEQRASLLPTPGLDASLLAALSDIQTRGSWQDDVLYAAELDDGTIADARRDSGGTGPQGRT